MTYQTISDILEQQNADVGAAEAQGIAVGMLVVEEKAVADNWLRELFSAAELSVEEENTLHALFQHTRQALAGDLAEFAFDLLLPEDDEPLAEQVEALRHWCLGFLFGVGYAHSSGDWPGEIGEIMQDIIELTKIDSDVEDEEDANALMEVREYLRAAVFTVKDYFLETSKELSH